MNQSISSPLGGQQHLGTTWLPRVAIWLGVAVACVGAGYFTAWTLGYMDRDFDRIAPSTNGALSLLLLGVALSLAVAKQWSSLRVRAIRVMAGAALAIGLLTFTEHLTEWDPGIDQLFAWDMPEVDGLPHPNRMGPPSAVALSLASLALLAFSLPKSRGLRIAQMLALTLLVVGMLGILGHLYNVGFFYELIRLTAIAWPTAAALLLFGLGLLLARPAEGVMARVTAPDSGGALIRRLLLPIVLLPIGLGWLHLTGLRLGLFNDEMGTSLLILIFIVSYSLLVYFAGGRVSESGAVLRGKEKRYRTLFDSAGIGIVEVEGDDHFIAVNNRACEILGRSREELLNMNVHLLTWPEDRGLSDQVNAEVHAGRSDRYSYEKRYLRGDGSPVWAHVTVSALRDEQGRWIRSITTIEDISHRKAIEQQLQQSELFYRQMLESIPGMVFTTRADGYCDYQSRQWVEFTGVPMNEHLGEGWNKLLHPDDQPRALAAWHAAVKGPASYELEYRVRRHDGQYCWFRVLGRPIRDARDQVVRWFGVLLEIDSLKRAEEQLRESEQRLTAANQAKDHFMAVLSHELRTPLTPVLASVSMLQERGDLDEEVAQYIDIIRRNVEMEARLIDDLLDVTRIARGKVHLEKRPVELCEVIQRAVEVCRPDIEARQLEFSMDLGSSRPYIVCADIARLQQVFWNLLKNAIKFTPHGGSVTVQVQPGSDGEVIAEISDTGQGIPPDALDRIFNAFEQIEQASGRQFGGLGLGLAISKALIEMHGGQIEAHSAGKGRGATFRVRLPIERGAATKSVRTEAAPAGKQARSDTRNRILLVEDHGDTARIMARLLKGQGYDVTTAGDVASALQAAAADHFDLLVSDLGLPDASGLDLMRHLRQSHPDLVGIALSGYGMEHDMQQSAEAGFAEHLTKPVDLQMLRSAIERAITQNI